ncbi:MAG: 23S rRNA (guanosine(2251)-2'-O)-methyltransferase RlmB [Bacteroidia bacterium]|nr:MAG: 23S rRNA (guanosine(2251)-2'-O)-methyltransferase RlmB [Bacteroidia bacterium]
MKSKNNEGIVYGIHAIEELLKDSTQIKKIEKIFVDEKKQRSLSSLLNKAREHKISVQYVPEAKIEKLAKGKNHQGIVAHLLDIHYHSLLELVKNNNIRLIVFLDRITDVRNFGAIARSAYAMGVDAILIPSKDTASINADAIKTSAGALLKIPVCKEQNITEALMNLKKQGFQIVACHEKTSKRIYEVDFTKPTVIILGSEHNGILKEYLKICDSEAKIPMNNAFDSLNVSVSAGIVLYEVVRQKEVVCN